MSKIEKALKRAHESGERGEPDAAMPRTGSELVPRKTTSVDTPASTAATKLIPQMRQPYRLESEQRSRRKIIAPDAMDSPIVKSMRAIRTKLLQKAGGNNGVVMVVGATPGSGTSFVAVNLATAFALDAAKTSLLVDCNVRHPFLHNVLLKEPTHGLVD
jgi:Mrp family chromosome partitioning ATPase